MPFISMTRLRLKSFGKLIPFMRANNASIKDLNRCEGLLEAKELIDKNFTFWTLTLWKDPESMKQFRNGTAHAQAMRNLPDWCDEASYHHWETEDQHLPDWQTASQKLITEGRMTKVRFPSANQLTGKFPDLQWTKTSRNIKK